MASKKRTAQFSSSEVARMEAYMELHPDKSISDILREGVRKLLDESERSENVVKVELTPFLMTTLRKKAELGGGTIEQIILAALSEVFSSKELDAEAVRRATEELKVRSKISVVETRP